MLRQVTFAVLVLVLFVCSTGNAHIVGDDLRDKSAGFVQPQEAVEMFLKAVDAGELSLFDITLSRPMLTPLRVEYVYDLPSSVQTIKVYAELKETLAIPGRVDCEINALTAVMNALGHITEVVAHVCPK